MRRCWRQSACSSACADFCHHSSKQYPVTDARIARLHQRVASRYTKGAIALAGDAAHLNHPLGGMGLNAGIHRRLPARPRPQAGNSRTSGCSRDRRVRERATSAGHHPRASDCRRVSRASAEAGAQARRQRNEEMRAAAADPSRALQFLYQASMFDSAPARWEKAASRDEQHPDKDV